MRFRSREAHCGRRIGRLRPHRRHIRGEHDGYAIYCWRRPDGSVRGHWRRTARRCAKRCGVRERGRAHIRLGQGVQGGRWFVYRKDAGVQWRAEQVCVRHIGHCRQQVRRRRSWRGGHHHLRFGESAEEREFRRCPCQLWRVLEADPGMVAFQRQRLPVQEQYRLGILHPERFNLVLHAWHRLHLPEFHARRRHRVYAVCVFCNSWRRGGILQRHLHC